jgi:hypothetical protein
MPSGTTGFRRAGEIVGIEAAADLLAAQLDRPIVGTGWRLPIQTWRYKHGLEKQDLFF